MRWRGIFWILCGTIRRASDAEASGCNSLQKGLFCANLTSAIHTIIQTMCGRLRPFGAGAFFREEQIDEPGIRRKYSKDI